MARFKPFLMAVFSHPIQYHSPLFQLLATAADIDSRAVYLSAHGVAPTYDSGFGQTIAFDVPLLGDHEYVWTRNLSPRPGPRKFTGLVNPQVLRSALADADVVLLFGWGSASMWLAQLGARFRTQPYMVRGDTNVLMSGLGGFRGRLKRATVGPFVRGATRVLSVGTRNTQFYRAMGVSDTRIRLAPFCVDNDYFAVTIDERAAARRNLDDMLGLNPSARNVLFSGKLVPNKRPGDFLEACLSQEVPVNVIVAGSGPMLESLKAKYSHRRNVHFLGFVNQSQLRQVYAGCDILVLPSQREAWGLAVNEAMAAGCLPIVAEEAGCVPDLVLPSIGAVFPSGDAQALAEQIGRLLELDDLTEAIGRCQEVVNTHSLERSAEAIATATIECIRGANA